MSKSCQEVDRDVLVRFWSIDQPERASVTWPVSEWSKLVFAADGTLVVSAEDQISVLPPNRALWVLPGCRHEMSCRSAVSVRTLYFHPSFSPNPLPRPMQVRGLLRELITETCCIGPLLRTDDHHLCLAKLLRAEIAAAPASQVSLSIPKEDVARQAAQLVVNDPSRYFDVQTVLEAVGCSRRTLERRFHSATGMSLGRWIQQARLVLSIQSLSGIPSILDVALAAGYSSASAYTYAFRRHFGILPSQWRRSA